MNALHSFDAPDLIRGLRSAGCSAVPGLTRDLIEFVTRGPGSSPGLRLRFVNQFAPCSIHDLFHLHSCLQLQYRDLHRRNRKPVSSRGAAQGRKRRSVYRTVSHSQAGVLRNPRISTRGHSPRTTTQAMATGLENPVDRGWKPRVDGFEYGGVVSLNSLAMRSPRAKPGAGWIKSGTAWRYLLDTTILEMSEWA